MSVNHELEDIPEGLRDRIILEAVMSWWICHRLWLIGGFCILLIPYLFYPYSSYRSC
jgi:hypothetical protein